MPQVHRGDVHQSLRTLFGAGTLAGLSDGELLERFSVRRGEPSEHAFAVLLERHAPMVRRVCRQVLGDAHEAEDAFQATFLVLARNARAVRRRDTLGPYLHGVALRVAACARSAEARRRSRERRYAGSAPAWSHASLGDDTALAVHQELDGLPQRFRTVAVLCLVEEKTYADAARLLGCPIGTVMSRLSEARRRLRSRLARRGLAPSAGVVAAALAGAGDAGAVAQALASTSTEALLQTAITLAANPVASGRIPVAVANLTSEVSRTMLLTKLTALAAAAAAGFGLVTVGAAVLAQPASRPRPPDSDQVAPAQRVADEQYGDLIGTISYRVTLDPSAVYELPSLTIERRQLRIATGPVALVPIACQPGITGAMLIGNGSFRFTPPGAQPIEGRFRAAMLRFNPDEQAAIAPLDKAVKTADRGTVEIGRHLMDAVFGHCWHSGKQALIPPQGAFTAVFFSREHGDLLITVDARTALVHSFTDRKTLYQEKP